MALGCSLRGLALYSLLFSIVGLGSARDVSDISFENDGPSSGYHPQNFNATESQTLPGVMMLRWDPPSNITSVIGYQVLYWRPSTSSYSYINVTLENTTADTDRLPGFTEYYFSVRSRLEDRFSLAVQPVSRCTISRPPDGIPMVINHTSPYNEDYTQIKLYWSGINDSSWNGINNTYIVDMFDVTTDVTTNNRGRYFIPRSAARDVYDITVTSLTVEHEYLVYVYASSSGGLGYPSNPYRVFITSPTVTPTVQPTTRTWQFYVIIIPSVIGLAIFIAAIILCIKLCLGRNKRNVSYVRDINKNIEDGTVMNSRMPARFDSARLSNQNRPLPPNPHTPTPSAMSVNARLIKDYSPPFDHAFSEYPPGSYPHQQQHSHLHHQFSHHSHHHPIDLHVGDPGPVMGMDTRMRANSATSPHYPTLSQPLSDMSSVTPTSVFAESSNPGQSQGLSQGHTHHHAQRFLSNRSPVSPTNPNPYEVPNESESGHHSVSPPGHHHTLPGTRRPLTTNHSTGQFYPISSSHPHHGPTSPFSQGNMDMFQFESAPPVPPHRSTTNLGQGIRASPPDADYSEIPDDSPTEKPPPAPYDNQGSPIQSEQYNSYSDIPTAVSPYNIGVIGGGGHKEKMSPGHSSLSESISSFSTDSQSTSPARGAVGPSHGHMRGTNVSPSYRGRGNSQTNGSIPRSGSKSHQNVEPHRSPESSAPYLSPTSIKSSSNSDTRTTSPPSQ
ncbi:PREDICTED: uncharacterized protein LOC109581455 [Amphimedon queenslandica]|uniref:Fibronectin type-III domain-containing protein n=1 Tax=Amphimedon queenslandica TaxID=400682 RepID=A0A1X7V1S0_AMPQE|nr:PREDICTED: uncharacterized protein LOC109581455 [Amphimedon queenslandica]|eukprot:XP_019851123.1 PREDICTED: uncharacterized protein LOC109581455 [Amphimedon queenslandica]